MRRDLDVCRSILLELQAKHDGAKVEFCFATGEKLEFANDCFTCPAPLLYQYNFSLLN